MRRFWRWLPGPTRAGIRLAQYEQQRRHYRALIRAIDEYLRTTHV